MVWIFNNTAQSVFGAALFHAMLNVSLFLFPNDDSHCDPRITGLIVMVAVATVTVAEPRVL